MEKIGVGLINMAKDQPFMYIFTLLCFIGALIIFGFTILRIIKGIIESKLKKVKRNKDGEIVVELGDDSPESQIEHASETSPQIYDNLSNLANLIIDFPEAARKYETAIFEIKHQLTEEQYKDFSNEIKKYRVHLNEYYCKKLKLDESDDKARLFRYWLKQTTNEDVTPQIESILFRNGLNEKTAEQIDDMLRKLYEETFSHLCDSIDEAPPYIKVPELKEIITSSKNEYRSALETGLNNARKRRIEREASFEKARQEYINERMEILNRDLPKDVVEKIKENVK